MHTSLINLQIPCPFTWENPCLNFSAWIEIYGKCSYFVRFDVLFNHNFITASSVNGMLTNWQEMKHLTALAPILYKTESQIKARAAFSYFRVTWLSPCTEVALIKLKVTLMQKKELPKMLTINTGADVLSTHRIQITAFKYLHLQKCSGPFKYFI